MATPRTIATLPFAVPRLGELLGRRLESAPATTGAREALLATLE
jgi:hypothetical protein